MQSLSHQVCISFRISPLPHPGEGEIIKGFGEREGKRRRKKEKKKDLGKI